MDVLRVIILKEASQIAKDKYQINIIRYHLDVKTKKYTNELILKKQTDRCREQSYCDQSRRRREG